MQDLVPRLLALDEQAFEEFSDFFAPALRRFFIRKGLDPSDAEDLAVTCVADTAMKIGKFRVCDRGTFSAWVYQIARRKFLDWNRIRNRQRRVELAVEQVSDSQGLSQDTASESESFALDLDTVLAVQSAMARLSDTDREIIQLRILSGDRTFEDIGSELGIQVSAARTRYHRAAKRLEEIMLQDDRLRQFQNRRKSA
jgi:RNA polymerase sigma factor (sigma-70 family)